MRKLDEQGQRCFACVANEGVCVCVCVEGKGGGGITLTVAALLVRMPDLKQAFFC